MPIDQEIKKQFGSWTAFCKEHGHDKTNFKRKLMWNIDKINKWIDPLGLKIEIVKK